MIRPALLLLLSGLAANVIAAGPGQVGGPGEPMGEIANGRCPPGWQLQGKAKANGAFTCRPAKGQSAHQLPLLAPEPIRNCPVNTSYFIKGRQLGCAALPVKKHAAQRKTS